MEKSVSFEMAVVIPAPPGMVFEALTDPELHSAFTGSPADGEAVEGGIFTAWDGYIEGRHLELVPGERIVWEWVTVEWPENAPVSRVEIGLTACAEGTDLKMVHSGVPASQATSYRKGWTDYYWKPLQRYFGR